MFDDKQVQTSSRFEPCLACKISQDCIKTVAKELLQQKQDQHVMEAKYVDVEKKANLIFFNTLLCTFSRKRIQSSIFDVTQLDSMTLLCNAIKNDISHLVKQNRDIEANMEEQGRMYEYLNYNYQDILKRNECLLVKIQELEELEQGRTVLEFLSNLYQIYFIYTIYNTFNKYIKAFF